jgi:hypothetical protein
LPPNTKPEIRLAPEIPLEPSVLKNRGPSQGRPGGDSVPLRHQ